MSSCALNGLTVYAADIAIPLTGPWVATVDVEGEAPTGKVALEFDGGTRFEGTVRDSGEWQGRSRAFLVGGLAKLGTALPAKLYVAGNLGMVAADVCAETGESLADGVQAALAGTPLAFWSRPKQRAALTMGDVARRAGGNWRVLDDGSVWVGVETWDPAPKPGFLESEDPFDGTAMYAEDSPLLRPGYNLNGKRIGKVTVKQTPEGLRTRVVFEAAA